MSCSLTSSVVSVNMGDMETQLGLTMKQVNNKLAREGMQLDMKYFGCERLM